MSDHLHRLQTVYDDRFARDDGPWRPVVAQVADTFLACGVLEHGFARIRCDACAHESLLAFSCNCRYFCPSCHAKRLAIWTQWLDTTLLRLRGRARRRAGSPIDPETVRTGRRAATRTGPLSLTPTACPRAGAVGVGDGPAGASDRSPPASPSTGDRHPDRPRGAPAGQSARKMTPPPVRRRSRGQRSRRILGEYSIDPE